MWHQVNLMVIKVNFNPLLFSHSNRNYGAFVPMENNINTQHFCKSMVSFNATHRNRYRDMSNEPYGDRP